MSAPNTKVHAKTRKRVRHRALARKVAARHRGPRIGSSFEDYLDAEGIRAEVTVLALKRVIAWQLRQEMERQAVTKQRMASLMETSRAAVDRLLDPESAALSLKTLDKAAQALGKRVSIELVDHR